MQLTPPGASIELAVILRFVDVAYEALAEAAEEIDALNVYPVPDGDTGTNLHLTLAAGRDAVRAAAEAGADRNAGLAALSRGTLLGARGNSGVILSEMLGAIGRRIARSGPEERNAVVVAEALHEAVLASYAAVGTPVEGTMLSVARAAADAAERRAADVGVRARDVFTAAAAAARAALLETPDQLSVLAHAGVVDAGGRGIVVVLDAAESALTGRRPSPAVRRRPIPMPRSAPAPAPAAGSGAGSGAGLVTASGPVGSGSQGPAGGPAGGAHELTPDGPAYEVMYLLDADDAGVATLRARLAGVGDSLVVIGGEGLWNVHVHVDDVGAAIEAGIEAGRPHRVRVTHFAEQDTRPGDEESGSARHCGAHRRARQHRRAVVAVAAGPGLHTLFVDAGASVVTPSARRASTRQFLDAIQAAVTGGADEVLLLPNDATTLRTARVAAGMAEADGSGLRVAVIPTRAQVQGLAAMAVHEAGRSFDADVLEMTATARRARHGAVTVANGAGMTTAGLCERGDVLGFVESDVAVIGSEDYAVTVDVLSRLLGSGAELVTLVSGAGPHDTVLAARCAAWVEQSHPTVEVVTYAGGQARYSMLVAVE